jgi:hypothetical protein
MGFERADAILSFFAYSDRKFVVLREKKCEEHYIVDEFQSTVCTEEVASSASTFT